MSYQHWRYTIDETRTGWLEIDVKDSSVNILRREVLDEWAQLMTEIKGDDQLSALCLVSGKSNGFVYGADIAEFDLLKGPDDVNDLIVCAHQIMNDIEALAIPTICGIDGVAVGGGLEVALPFKQIIAVRQPGTKLGFPEIHLGLFPGFGGTGRSLRRVGVAASLDMVLSGRLLGADEAFSLNLIDHVIEDASELRAAMRAQLAGSSLQDKTETPETFDAALVTATQTYCAKADKDATPAPFEIIDHYRRSAGDWKKLVQSEIDIFASLLLGEASHHLRRAFLMSDAVRKTARGDSAIVHVHVIGAGTMGGDIAAVAALNGFQVSLSDQDSTAIDKAIARATALFARRLKSEKAQQDAQDRLVADPQSLGIAKADIIIEAVAERLEVKQAVFKAVEEQAKSEAILATNTSSIMIEDIAQILDHPERLIGLHFFNPVPVLPLVEVIFGPQSQSDYLSRAMCFAGQMKKMPIKVKSEKGFLVNRALLPYIYKAISLMCEGENPDELDQAMVKFGMPMGPIELADQVGLDVCYDVGTVIGMPTPASDALQQRIKAGQMGRKSGTGFYQWDGKKALRERADYPKERLEKLANILLEPMIEKCRTAVSEGIVATQDDADIGCIMGIGFPRYRGGPLGWANYPR